MEDKNGDRIAGDRKTKSDRFRPVIEGRRSTNFGLLTE